MENMITRLTAIVFGQLANMLIKVFHLPADSGKYMTSKDRLDVALRRIATRMSHVEFFDDQMTEILDRLGKLEKHVYKEELNGVANGDHFVHGNEADCRHPMQPIYKDEHGVHRYKPNAIVRYLLDSGRADMNHFLN